MMKFNWIYLVAILMKVEVQCYEKFDNSTEIFNVTAVKVKQSELKSVYAAEKCPVFLNGPLSQTELFDRLIHPCRYDKIQRPDVFDENGKLKPVDVFLRAYVFYMQNLDTFNLLFTLQMRFQIRFNDPRLVFDLVSTNETDAIMGEADMRRKLWSPHTFFVNERNSGILGSQGKDVITAIKPDGTVLISYRLQVSLYCSMNFRKFPFDQQTCKSSIDSWIHDASTIKLHWEKKDPFTLGPDKILSEYSIVKTVLNETELNATKPGGQYGNFVGNYSSLIFIITLDRSIGQYLLDYYFPSILIVAISWVTFWLQADQTSPRALLGTASMLAFITLSAAQTKTLAKVSYIKASEIWFMGCAIFIFGSLIEFAFVNLLWRRTKFVELQKVTTTNILKKTFKTNLSRRFSGELRKSHSDTSLNKDVYSERRSINFGNKLGVVNPSYLPTSSGSLDDINFDKSIIDVVIAVPKRIKNSDPNKPHHKHLWTTTLTHQEIAILLDRKARLMFPLAFLIFNIFYWIVMNI